MPRSYTEHYAKKRKYLSEQVEEGLVTESDANAIRELVEAFDEDKPTTTKPAWPNAPSHLTKYRADSTLANWLYHLTTYAKEIELLDTSADEINGLAGKWIGEGSEYKNGGLTKGTVRAYQNTIRIFYRYHDDLAIDFNDISVFESQDTSVQSRDMLTPEEITKVREAPTHPRDSAIIDLLLYTGMRNRALRTLRIKDVDTQEGIFYFNTDQNGLKNLYKPNASRPLLGSVASVRDWINYHPASDNPEAYLIMGKPKYGNPDPEEPVSDRTIQRVLDSVKEETGITKDLHPHMLRHNMVSLCKTQYDMDDSTVKFLIGHKPDSQVMETTYSHISADDFRKKAERKMGIRDDEPESSLTPDYCDVCNEPLEPGSKACPRCGTLFTPDAKAAKDKIEEDVYEAKGELEGQEEESLDNIKENLIDEIASDPELMDELADRLKNQ